MNQSPRQRLRRFFWMHPEWWAVILAVTAWAAIVVHAVGFGRTHQHHQIFHEENHNAPATLAHSRIETAHHGHHHTEHIQADRIQNNHNPRRDDQSADFQAASVQPQQIVTFGGELLGWSLMVVAMMLPLMFEPMRWVAFQSFRHRRHQSALFFLIGYLLPWGALGIAAAWLRTFSWFNNPLVAAAIFAAAAVWVLFAGRRRALAYCHKKISIAPCGWKANRDCLRFGLTIGTACVAVCGFLMLGCAFSGHSVIAMLGGGALSFLERRSFRYPTYYIFAGTLILAIWFLLPASWFKPHL